MKLKYTHLILCILLMMLSSCKKDWLDKKSNIALVVPTTLKDMRLLLNEDYPVSTENRGMLDVAAADYYISDNDYSSLSSNLEKGLYIWSDKAEDGLTNLAEWDDSYGSVLNANVILEGLAKITPDKSNITEYNDIKGGALYRRACAFYNLVQIFSKPYDPKTSANDLGIPLRTATDINVKSVRATVQQTYDQITGDLLMASTLLKITPTYKTNSSRTAAYGELARCYLSMGEYDKALQYSDLSLMDYNKLIDYNTLDPANYPPFPLFNDEVIYEAEISSYFISSSPPVNKIDSNLLKSYDDNDLRRTMFFLDNGDGSFGFQGEYSGQSSFFGGIATDEMYLIRAECEARAGNASDALTDLNTLLKNRFKTGTFTNVTAASAPAALGIILIERRKELLMRGLRWSDLRRLNKDPQYAVTLSRKLNGQTYTLPPNDPRYTFLIPDYIIKSSGIQQTIR